MLNKWNKIYKGRDILVYGDAITYIKGMVFLDGYGDIEDWGCGTGYAGRFTSKSKYIGIDGSKHSSVDRQVDLTKYVSNIDCVFIRHVFGHNWDWRLILKNALGSFQKRMVIIVFVPMEHKDRLITMSKKDIPVLAISRIDFEEMLKGLKWRFEVVRTHTQFWLEQIYYITK